MSRDSRRSMSKSELIARIDELEQEAETLNAQYEYTLHNLRQENNYLKSELRRSNARRVGDNAAAAAALPNEREAIIEYYERIIAETNENAANSYIHPQLAKPSQPGVYRYGITLTFPKPDEIKPDGEFPIDTWKAVGEFTGDRSRAENWAKTNIAYMASRLPMPEDFSGRKGGQKGAAEMILTDYSDDEKMRLFQRLRPFYDRGPDTFNMAFGILFNELLPRLDLELYAEYQARDSLKKWFKLTFEKIDKHRELEAWEWEEI